MILDVYFRTRSAAAIARVLIGVNVIHCSQPEYTAHPREGRSIVVKVTIPESPFASIMAGRLSRVNQVVRQYDGLIINTQDPQEVSA